MHPQIAGTLQPHCPWAGGQRCGQAPSPDGGLPRKAEPIWAEIWHQEAHHSTALEGNTLVLREAAELLDPGRAVGAKPLREYNEVKGYADAARWVYGQGLEPEEWSDGELIVVNQVRRIHHMAMNAGDSPRMRTPTTTSGPAASVGTTFGHSRMA